MMMPVRGFWMSFSSSPEFGDRLLHGDVVPGRALAHEAGGAAVEHFERIELGRAMDLAAEIQIGIFLRKDDAGRGSAQSFRAPRQ
ncbi:MAG: hypothetical protein NVV63_11750 [Opitutus sp.]|nr:hypothetical protein [Opitutus sp.]